MTVKSIELLLTSWFVSHRTLATRTPNSWNPHESLTLSAEYSIIRIVFFVEGDFYLKIRTDAFATGAHLPIPQATRSIAYCWSNNSIRKIIKNKILFIVFQNL